MANVAYVAAGTAYQGTASSTSHAVSYPIGIVAGDVLVLIQCSSGITNVIFTTPAGWTQLYQAASTGNTLAPTLGIWIKVSDGTETGSLTVAHATTNSSGIILAYRNVDLTQIQDCVLQSIDQSAAVTNHVIPAMTIVKAGTVIITAATANGNSHNATPPTGLTEIFDRTVASTRDIEIAHKIGLIAGSTGTNTVVWSLALRGLAASIALRPKPDAIGAWGIPI